MPDGRRVLVSRELVTGGREVSQLGWQVQLGEPKERVYQRADALALQILWVSMCLGAATALLGVLGTRQLTARLKRLDAVRRRRRTESSRTQSKSRAGSMRSRSWHGHSRRSWEICSASAASCKLSAANSSGG